MMLCVASGGLIAACGGSGDARSQAASKMLAARTVACTAWQEGGTYAAGTVVTYQGGTYTALVAQTDYAGSGWNPVASPSLWSAGGICGAESTPTPTPTPTPAPTPTPIP